MRLLEFKFQRFDGWRSVSSEWCRWFLAYCFRYAVSTGTMNNNSKWPLLSHRIANVFPNANVL